MSIYLLDTEFRRTKLIDEYISMIWTDRYAEAGDFELYVAATVDNVSIFKTGMYLSNTLSEHLMIIETIEIKSDIEEGAKLLVTGRSLESLLERRIVWNQTVFKNKNSQDIMFELLKDSIISPVNASRKIDNFIFERLESAQINSIRLDKQYTGDNIYTVINELCNQYGIGFKLIRENNQFHFRLYIGNDHTQGTDSFVTFSPRFDNLISSNVITSIREYANVACVAGEGEGASRTTSSAGNEESGIERMELFVDARNVSSKTEKDSIISPEQYKSMLLQKGMEELNSHQSKTTIESEVDYNGIFKYKKDFDVGDIVNVSNEFGYSGKLRITEIVTSDSVNGMTIIPTFKAI